MKQDCKNKCICSIGTIPDMEILSFHLFHKYGSKSDMSIVKVKTLCTALGTRIRDTMCVAGMTTAGEIYRVNKVVTERPF